MKLIRIGNGKPHLHFDDDRWGQPTSRLTTNGYGYIDQQKYAAINCFQTPLSLYLHEKEEFKTLGIDTGAKGKLNPNISDTQYNDLTSTLFGKRLSSVMALSGRVSTLWEFNAYATRKADPEDCIRFMAPLSEPYIVKWTWLDMALYRLYKVIAYIWNKFENSY